MEFNIPSALKREHEELHKELAKATKEGGSTGEAARSVARILHPHFVKEEEYALPPLGLLTHLTKGETTPDMKSVLKMTDKLKRALPQMLEEHKAIVGALEKLADAAREQGKTEYITFSEKLTLHAQTEEQILYPAALLIGEYVKMRF
jgi:hemerythrin superfamily protein